MATDWSETQAILDLADEQEDPEKFIQELGQFERARLESEGVIIDFIDDDDEVETR